MVHLSCLANLKIPARRNPRLRPATAPPQPSNGLAPPRRSQPVLSAASQPLGECTMLRYIPQFRHAADLPQPRGAPARPLQTKPQNRVPPLQNLLWRAPQGGITVSGRLNGLVPLDSAPQPNSDICTVPEQTKDRQPRPMGISRFDHSRLLSGTRYFSFL